MLKGVIHDRDDEEGLAFLRSCRAVAMSAKSKRVLIDRILPERIEPEDAWAPGNFIHMQMRLNVNGP